MEQELAVLRAAQSKRLELQAVAMVKQYGLLLMMKRDVKEFFANVADFNQWDNLKEALK